MNEEIDSPEYYFGVYPWDEWQCKMMKQGMERTLAELGRDVLREADQHNWSQPLRQLCYEDNLAELLLAAPYLGRRLCEILLETDGFRIAYIEESETAELIRLDGFKGGC